MIYFMWKFGTKGGKMLEDIFKRNSRIMLRKMLYIFIIINLLSYIFIFLLANVSKAATDHFSKYPGYQELINELKKEFPKSEFKMLKTGLDWNQVIKNETTASHGRNLTSNSGYAQYVKISNMNPAGIVHQKQLYLIIWIREIL